MQAVIDIGDQKTGSKSRQTLLKDNLEELEKSGCYCLKATSVGAHDYDMGLAAYAGSKGSIERFRHSRSLENEEYLDCLIEKNIADEVNEKKCSRVFFSFEGLIGLNVGQIEKLTSMLYRYFDEILIIGFLRRQDRKAVSAYSTRLKNQCATDLNILNNMNGKPRGSDYSKNYEDWSKFVPSHNIFFVNYDECLDVSHTFAYIANLPESLVFGEAKKNTSLSALGAEILRRFNMDLAHREEYKGNASKVREKIKECYSGEGLRPSKRDAQVHFEKFSNSNMKLAKHLGSKNKFFFDEKFSEYPDEFSPVELSLVEVDQYIQKALRSS